ncbi:MULTISPECIES: class I adenylate-forming enzyme family protein [unclassified Nocardioides]|uniref:class I adenylate-forming enzyme family protein n=1 Tax=unclassified Nocardioides TaxID=2615069 RepID=UPI000700C6C8|nr:MULTISPECIES: AMP-binding protein [unclassified Nocardioides]KRA31075.1 hypothetical protein ASD81_16435 [Nocardioides sp. Root614]KRA87695.1 hypothetical protein ASD84_16705 [Nocardioides sp. Root682]
MVQRAEDTPDRTLIHDVTSEVSLSYGDVVRLAREYAGALIAMGCSSSNGSRIAAMLPNGAEAFVAQTGMAWAGAIFVPVSPSLRGQPLTHVLRESRAEVVLTLASCVPTLAEIWHDLEPGMRVVVIDDADTYNSDVPVIRREQFLASGLPVTAKPVNPEATRAIIFTSGTSGPPKPVALSFGAMDNYARHLFPDAGFEWSDDAGYYSPWGMTHALGSIGMSVAIHRGLHLVVRDRFEIDHFWSDVSKHNVEACLIISVSHLLWQQEEVDAEVNNPLRLVGMTPLIREYPDFAARFGLRISSIYGMTEIGPAITHLDPVSAESAGKPTDGYNCRIVDPDGLDVPEGTVGELMVCHADTRLLMSGYDGLPDATAKAWERGWFRTGDRFVVKAGQYCFVDRLTDSIRHRGRNISSFEVEGEALAHPAVAACACVGHRVSLPGDDDRQYDEDVRLFVVAAAAEMVDPEDLVKYLSEKLPAYMVPKYIDLVAEIPTNASGRSLKAELRLRPITESTWTRTAAG